MPTNHALLSASSSARWINCPPSVRLCEGLAERESAFAAEGTDAHTLCEYKLKKALGIDMPDPTPNLTYYDQEMEDCAEEYALFITSIVEELKEKCPDTNVMIEQHLDFSSYVPNGFGTGDCIIASDTLLRVIDFKYGKGLKVEAKGNTQMLLYALGAYEIFGPLFGTENIELTIFQPRLQNISTSRINTSDLYKWVNDVLVPAAKLAFNGEGDTKAGPWCRFCKVKAQCRKRAETNMQLASYEFKEPPLLDDEELSKILTQVDELISWSNDVKEYALSQALKGKCYEGFKLVEGRSVRKYSDQQMAAKAVKEAGFDPYDHKIKGITAMTSLLGKTKFNELLGDLLIKPHGKPTLVPQCDKRPEITIDDFNDTEE